MCRVHPVVLPQYETNHHRYAAARPVPSAGTGRRRVSEHREVYKQTGAFVAETLAGAGNGIRTRDPDLGKVVLYH
jgi:hypothetical protein